MIFALLTLLAALSLATTAGWFSIVGFMAIYAGAPIPALIMGAVTELAKLVTVSWIYRNWEYAGWRLKVPLIYFTIALMVATSIGVFGFLSKAHLEQGAGTIDNSSRIETLNYQINREKSLIADNEKVIGQLDATVNSFLGKDRTDKSLSVRKSQAPQRKQLRDDSDAAQKRIDGLSTDKFKLESEVRKMQLDVGPIRYIAELFYGVEENATKNIEAAVRIFTLLIVSTLDPLAVILLVAANHTLLRLRNEKEKAIPAREEDKESEDGNDKEIGSENSKSSAPEKSYADVGDTKNDGFISKNEKAEVHVTLPPETMEFLDEEETPDQEIDSTGISRLQSSTSQSSDEDPMSIIREILAEKPTPDTEGQKEEAETVRLVAPPVIKTPLRTRVTLDDTVPEISAKIEPAIPTVGVSNTVHDQDSIMKEIVGYGPHFTPQKVIEKSHVVPNKKALPNVLSWLSEFKRS